MAKKTMEKLAKNEKDFLRLPQPGDIIEGKLIKKGTRRMSFDLSPYGTGVVYKREFYDMPHDLNQLRKGDRVPLKVLDLENEEGLIELSMKRARKERGWAYVKKAKEEAKPITIKVMGANRGGLLTKVRGIDAFIPVSQLSSEHYPEVGGDKEKILEHLQQFINQELTVKIIAIEEEDQKLILSERADEIKKIKEKIKNYHIGDVITGKVCGIVDYGAFVEFDQGLEGLVHISELDWKLIEDPHNVVSKGEKVKAKIIDIEDDQISLSIKALKEDPWKKVPAHYKVGDVVTGKVIRVTSYGVFVKIEEKIQGLVPVSKFKDHKEMEKKMKPGKKYKFKIFSLDADRHRMGLVPADAA